MSPYKADSLLFPAPKDDMVFFVGENGWLRLTGMNDEAVFVKLTSIAGISQVNDEEDQYTEVTTSGCTCWQVKELPAAILEAMS
jgi:hypothetical protein